MNVQGLVTPRSWSLLQMLMLAMFGFTLMGWLAGGLMTTQLAQRTEAHLHDQELRQLGHLLLALSDHELDELGPNPDMMLRVQRTIADTVALGDAYRYQIWSDSGQFLLGNFGIGQHAKMARFDQTGYSTVIIDNAAWRVYSEHDRAQGRQIQIGERIQSSLDLWSAVDFKIAVMMVLSLALLLGSAALLLKRLLRPIDAVAHALERRSPDSLDLLPTRSVPREVAPMVQALNRLFVRLADALQRERTFTGVAAHEMRTPLAAVRVLAQVVRSAENEVERDHALDRLILGTDRCAHLLDQLLTLQRLDATADREHDEAIYLTDVVMEVLDGTRAEAQRRDVHVSAKLDGSAIWGHRFGILTLLRNLVSNALAYTPAGGRVEISALKVGEKVQVIVDDSGLGIAKQDRDRAFSRFERLGLRSGTGVGLGLSIVQTVADAHDATVQLDESPLGGLRVVACFDRQVNQETDDPLTQGPDSGLTVSDSTPADTQPNWPGAANPG